MEPEGSLPHSQVPATCPYPKPALSSSCPPHPTSWRSIFILSSHLRLGLASGRFPTGFPTETLYTPLLPHSYYMPHRPSHSALALQYQNAWSLWADCASENVPFCCARVPETRLLCGAPRERERELEVLAPALPESDRLPCGVTTQCSCRWETVSFTSTAGYCR